MKDKTFAYGLYFALGFLAVAIGGAFFIGLIRDVVNDSDQGRPDIPASPAISMVDPRPADEHLAITFPT
jgi:hypothetical protein